MQILQPPGWPRPKGYANGIAASGRMVFASGMVGWDAQGVFAEGFVAQAAQALRNALDVLAEAGAGPCDIVRMTWYVLDRDEYVAAGRALGQAYRELMGDHYPAMTAVAVLALMEPAARVEIEVTAVTQAPPQG
ncbi:enamine deaminase RidA (YjgF/YER057c/UK114 family) [Pseudoduganella flava]|uniref:Enamine deaminase RidA (YjgF/YER057c/UK114 family) n=1 Tax=Pseudoduganella flava TaxID=871742 RepID=A0A562Q4T9_9BURK|nr:RidA family protein [Pseudoduganella flava]QGZ41772.1 RidA family protein [Pseudoduganella flava]TWI51775.1 enamine deaminase RidA (YjgF/YER057c/UK114 family) [Pseudoduganella flava]